jgi:hypothetical protein
MITIDATALSLDHFNLTDTATGLGRTLPSASVHSLDLNLGSYRFGTLFGPVFAFAVTAADAVSFDPTLTFLSGGGTNTLKVHGFAVEVDATALSLDQFSMSETASGLGEMFQTAAVQLLRFIPGNYRFGTLFGPVFEFSVTGAGAVSFDPALTFASGSGTSRLKVQGFAVEIDATALSVDQFNVADSASGLTKTLLTSIVHPLNFIPGSYRLVAGQESEFLITRAGVFDYIPAAAPTLRGRGGRNLKVLETATTLEQLISTNRVGQITGSTSLDRTTWPDPVDPMGWPLLTNTGRWQGIGADLGANTDHNGRLYIFFGDTATDQRPEDPPVNSDMVAWTDETKVLRHGGHLPIGWNFVLPFEPTGIPGQPDWRFCLKCHSLFFFWDGDRQFKGTCPKGGAHDTFGFGSRFVIPFEPTSIAGQRGWRFCGKCAGMFWNEDAKFKGTCPAGGSHDPQGLVFVLPSKPDGAPDPAGSQGDWRLCRNCGGLHWDGYPDKGVCAGAPGGGIHLNAVLDENEKNFDTFRAEPPIGYLGSLETPNGAFSFDGRAYVFAGFPEEKYADRFRPGEPTPGQYLFSKDDPSERGPYKTEFLFSPRMGLCANDRTRTSFRGHTALGHKFVLKHGIPPSAERDGGWRSCKKCEAMFWDGNPEFKGVCQVSGAHEADPLNLQDYSFVRSAAEDPRNQANWQRCENCLALFWNGGTLKGLCPKTGGEHVGTGPGLLAPHLSIREDKKTQAHWRFCGKCKGLFWDGDGSSKGVCPKDRLPHESQGHDFVLDHSVGEDAKSQTNWRFCAKCAGLFYDGYIDKGLCPKDGKGHDAARLIFSLGHGFVETFDRQPKWQFCGQCSCLFYNGFEDKGVCPKDGKGHRAEGLVFGLRHNPGVDSNAEGNWRFCTQCFGMVREGQEFAFRWTAPWVVDNARHQVLQQPSGGVGKGLVMIGYDWYHFRLAWMPLTPGELPRYDLIQYYHARLKKWSSTIDSTAQADGYQLFSHPFPGHYTHVCTAWLPGPERWIVLYGTAWDVTKRFDEPIVARLSKDLLDWSDEIPLFDPIREKAYGVYMHMPGKDSIHPNVPPKQNPAFPEIPGWAYGAFLLNRFTTWKSETRVLGIYYLLSFGSPYQVHVMHSELRLL